MLLSEAIEALAVATRANGRTRRTVESYRQKLKMLVAFLGDVSVESVTAQQLRRYVVDLMERDLSPFTVASRVRHTKRLFNWLDEEGLITDNPVDRIRTPRPKRRKPKSISERDLLRLLKTTQGGNLWDLRDRSIILFLADTGARVGGLCGLDVGDLDLEAGLATVTEKRGKTRFAMFTAPTAEALGAWLQAAEIERGPVFLGLGARSEGALTISGVEQMLRRRADRGGCEGPTNPHAFRHAFARHYLLDGGDLATLSDLLGHADVSTTKAFYGIFRTEELRAKHRKHSPVRALLGGDGGDRHTSNP